VGQKIEEALQDTWKKDSLKATKFQTWYTAKEEEKGLDRLNSGRYEKREKVQGRG